MPVKTNKKTIKCLTQINIGLYLSRAENVVYILEKSFVFYFIVAENESDSFAFTARSSI